MLIMKKLSIDQLQKIANEVRQDILKMLLAAGSGHAAGSLGMAEIFTTLYFAVMNHDSKNPGWEERDRLIVSNGHVCPAQYAAMAHAGYFSHAKLKSYSKFGSFLQGHPERFRLPGIETTSGPLGCGLAQAAGMAYAARMDGARFRVFCIASDGEHDEGNHWEAVLFAGKNNLANLTLIVDRNNIQVDGHTEEVMPLEPLKAKYEAFNWHVLDIDGHNIAEIIDAIGHARAVYENPTVIIAHTIPGKGVDFMEWNSSWHAKAPNAEEMKIALKQLRTLGGKIITEHD
ncbi:MAG: transketolase [bacterium]